MNVTVSVRGNIKYQGPILEIGGGGTKTAYQCGNTHFVVLLPNVVEGKALQEKFYRICNEEEFMCNYLSALSLHVLPVISCIVIFENQTTLLALYAPSFRSFHSKGLHVIDCKNILGELWDPSILPVPVDDVEAWVPVFSLLVEDLKTLCAAGVRPSGDCYNLCIENGVVRFFGFDFTSKRYPLELMQKVKNGQKIEPIDVKECLKTALDTAIEIVFIICSPKYDSQRQKVIEHLQREFLK
jgi:hypothetical protein